MDGNGGMGWLWKYVKIVMDWVISPFPTFSTSKTTRRQATSCECSECGRAPPKLKPWKKKTPKIKRHRQEMVQNVKSMFIVFYYTLDNPFPGGAFQKYPASNKSPTITSKKTAWSNQVTVHEHSPFPFTKTSRHKRSVRCNKNLQSPTCFAVRTRSWWCSLL